MKFIPEYLGTSKLEAATEATLEAVKSNTDKLDIPLSHISVSIAAAAGLTDAQLRALPVPISGTFWQATQPISAATLPLPSGASTEATLALIKAKTDNLDVALSTRTKPADAQHAIIDSGTLTNLSQLGGTAISMNSGARDAGTLRVTIATNDVVPAEQSGTWTVQPGNTANTTAWKVDGSAVTQPVSIATAPALVAGSAIIGKVGIDQTAPGTTNAVQVTGGAADSTNTVIATAQKPIAASTYSPSLFQNLGANATLNVKASTGNVFSISCYNSNAASRYIQLHNTATTPAGAAVPLFSFLVPPSSQVIIGTDFFTDMGVNFSTGIAFAFSTTINTYTAGTAGEQSTFIQYK